MASSAATNGPHLVCRIPACKMARASGARLSSQEISFICYLVGRRLGGSAVGILAPRTLLAEMTSAMGRKKEGRKEGRRKRKRRKSEDREGEGESQRGLFSYRRAGHSSGGRCAFRSARYIAFLPSRNVVRRAVANRTAANGRFSSRPVRVNEKWRPTTTTRGTIRTFGTKGGEIGHRAPCGRGRPSLVPSSVARDIDVGVFHRRRRQRESVPALSPEQV